MNPRIRALQARNRLERSIIDCLTAHGWQVAASTMRVRLICLRVARPDCLDAAESAWAGLSRACHYHAYELDPADAEIAHLTQLVDRIVAQLQTNDGKP